MTGHAGMVWWVLDLVSMLDALATAAHGQYPVV
jgi:hypothetical protein